MSEIIIEVPSANIQVSSTSEPIEVTADSLAVTVSSNNYTVVVPSVTENITVSSNAVIHEVEFKTTVQATEPLFPGPGEQWFDTTINKLKVYSGGQWYEDVGVEGPQGPIGMTGPAGPQGPPGPPGESNTVISESEPLFATEGQQWYNPNNTVLSVFTDGSWEQVGADDLFF